MADLQDRPSLRYREGVLNKWGAAEGAARSDIGVPERPFPTMEGRDRFHSMDALRAFALLLGIVLHASMAFVRDTPWPFLDHSPSEVLPGVMYVIHIFRMTLFFFLAGFFARRAYYTKGGRAFLIDRVRRIFVPLIIGWLVLFPLWFAIVYVGDRFGPDISFKPGALHVKFTLMHLWFLYVLLALYALFGLTRAGLKLLMGKDQRIHRVKDIFVRRTTENPWWMLVLALPLAVVFYSSGDWKPLEGIPVPAGSWFSNISILVGYGTAYSFGWLCQGNREFLHSLEIHWRSHLIWAAISTGMCFEVIVGYHLDALDALLIDFPRALYALAYSVAAWSWTLALTGLASRFLPEKNPRLRYLADSSYWQYLMSVPVILVFTLVMATWNIHWSIKFSLVLFGTTSLLLISYRYCVRSTFVGAALNGRKY